MLRNLTLALIGFVAFLPCLYLLKNLAGLPQQPAFWLALLISWLGLPLLISRIWRTKPDLAALVVDADEPLMLAQVRRAQQQLPRFLTGLEQGELEAYIKYPQAFADETEHLWALAHERRGEEIIVSLASEPLTAVDPALPARQRVRLDDIEDWMLIDSQGKTQGGYTVLAMAQIYQRDYGSLPAAYVRDLQDFSDFRWPEDGKIS